MARPEKHPKTGVYWFRKAVPKDLREIIGKTEVVQLLRTKDVAEARKAHAELAAEIDARWSSLRAGIRRLRLREGPQLLRSRKTRPPDPDVQNDRLQAG